MTQKQADYAKCLRKKVVIFAINNLQITIEQLHKQMQTMGYGDSLRKLSLPALIEFDSILKGNSTKSYERLDAQGKKVWATFKASTWNKKQLYQFLASKFQKSAIQYLTKNEKGTLIKVLKSYEH